MFPPDYFLKRGTGFFDRLRRYAPESAKSSPVQEVIAPSIDLALVRAINFLSPDLNGSQTALLRLVEILKPPFLLSREIAIQASKYDSEPPEVVIHVAGYLEETRRRLQNTVLPFQNQGFTLTIFQENSRYDELIAAAEGIGVTMILNSLGATTRAHSVLELIPPSKSFVGGFSYEHDENIGVGPEASQVVADTLLTTLSTCLENYFG